MKTANGLKARETCYMCEDAGFTGKSVLMAP